VKIGLSLTSSIYRRSSPDAPELIVTTTILNADVLTLELREEQDNGTVLEEGFRMEHFTFYDLTTGGEVINKDPFPAPASRVRTYGRVVSWRSSLRSRS
jgi:hypothetical protein